MRRALIAFVLAGLATAAAAQDSTPFDMGPERSTQTEPEARPPEQPDRDSATEQTAPEATPPTEVGPADAATEATGEPVAGFRRFLLPGSRIVLAGEQSRRNWAIYLSQKQAESPSTLSFSYENSIVVAPENSSLSVVVNGTTIHREPIASSEAFATRQVPIPADLLRPGRNEIGFSAVHRHRTDCSLESTFCGRK